MPVQVPLSVRSIQVLHFDIMMVNGNEKFLISVSRPLGLIMSNYLKTKDSTSVEKELTAQVSGYRSKLFDIRSAICDSESTLLAQGPHLGLLGIELEPAAPGTHAVVVERTIGLLRVGMRKILCMLPYNLPCSLMKWLVAYAVRFHNCFPSLSGPSAVAPRELFDGRKIDFKRDAPAAFGAYAQVFCPSSSKMEPKTEAGLFMLPTGNRQGAAHFYLVERGEVLVRNQFKLMPIPIELIDEMNRRAASESGSVLVHRWKDPDVALERRGGNISIGEVSHAGDLEITFDPTHQVDAAAHEDDLVYQPVLADVDKSWSPVPPVQDQGTTEAPELAIQVDVPPVIDPVVSGNDDPSTVVAAVDEVAVPAEPAPVVEVPAVQSNEVRSSSGRVSIQNRRYQDANIHGRSKKQVKANASVLFAQAQDHQVRLQLVGDALFIQRNFCFRLTVKKAFQQFGRVASAAICKELSQLLRIPAFMPVKRNAIPTNKQMIRSMMFLKEKFKPDGEFDKLKARLVARGDMQPMLDDDRAFQAAVRLLSHLTLMEMI